MPEMSVLDIINQGFQHTPTPLPGAVAPAQRPRIPQARSVQDLIQSAFHPTDEERPVIAPRGPVSETLSALGAGFAQTGEAIGGTMEMIGIPGGKTIREEWSAIGDLPALQRPTYLQQDDAIRGSDWRWWVRNIGENVPNLVMMYSTGAAIGTGAKIAGAGIKAIRTASLAGGFGSSFTLEAGSQYAQTKAEMLQEGYDEGQIENVATLEGLIAGTANAIIETIPMGNVFGRTPRAQHMLKRVLKQAFLEGSTEVLQETVNVFAEKIGHKPDQQWSDQVHRLLTSGIVGAVLGGGVGGPAGAAVHTQQTARYNALADQLALKDDIHKWKEDGLADGEIASRAAARIDQVRETQIRVNRDLAAVDRTKAPDTQYTLDQGGERGAPPTLPDIPEVDAREMVEYVLYGEGKYAPPAGPVAATTRRAKDRLVSAFGIRRKSTGEPPKVEADPTAAPMTPNAQATTDVGAQPQADLRIAARERKQTRVQAEGLFEKVLGDLDAEGAAEVEAARAQEQAAREDEQQALESQAAAQEQGRIDQALVQADTQRKALAGENPERGKIVDTIRGMKPGALIDEVKKTLGVTLAKDDTGAYVREFVDPTTGQPRTEPINLEAWREPVIQRRIADMDVRRQKDKADRARAAQRIEEDKQTRAAKDEANTMAFIREHNIALNRRMTPKQWEFIQARLNQLTPEELAKLPALEPSAAKSAFASMPGNVLKAQADYGVRGAQDEMRRRLAAQASPEPPPAAVTDAEPQATAAPSGVQSARTMGARPGQATRNAPKPQSTPPATGKVSPDAEIVQSRQSSQAAPEMQAASAKAAATPQEAILEERPNPAYTHSGPTETEVMREHARQLAQQLVAVGETGRIDTDEGARYIGAGGWIGETMGILRKKTTTPLKDTDGNPSIVTAKAEIAAALDKYADGKPLTDRQQGILEVVFRAARPDEAYARHIVESAHWEEKGYAPVFDEIPTENLAVGDAYVQDGERYEVIDVDPDTGAARVSGPTIRTLRPGAGLRGVSFYRPAEADDASPWSEAETRTSPEEQRTAGQASGGTGEQPSTRTAEMVERPRTPAPEGGSLPSVAAADQPARTTPDLKKPAQAQGVVTLGARPKVTTGTPEATAAAIAGARKIHADTEAVLKAQGYHISKRKLKSEKDENELFGMGFKPYILKDGKLVMDVLGIWARAPKVPGETKQPSGETIHVKGETIPATKAPWQMTQREVLEAELAVGGFDSIGDKTVVIDGATIPIARTQSIKKHRKAIEDAHLAGKEVPEKVLAAYPDLQKTAPETPEAEDAQKAEAAHEQEKKGIQDFGEKLGGARKDMNTVQSAERDIADDDLAKMTFSEIWPKAEVDSIEDPDLAALATALRNEVPAKPRMRHKVARWVESVKLVRTLMKYANEQGFDAIMQRMRSGEYERLLEGFASKIDLLRKLPREHWDRIGAVRNYPDALRYQRSDEVKEGEKPQTVPEPYAYAEVDGRLARGQNLEELTAKVLERIEGAAKPAMQFEIRMQRRGGYAFINKKGDPLYRKLKAFTGGDAVEQARAYIKNNHASLVDAWEAVKQSDNVKETDVRRQENRPRTGKDHRQGKDATPEMFTEAFGFRGVEFGNWVAQGKNAKERQGMLNMAYDALMDLADILHVPTRAISLNGTLGLGFGSRGHGWASAHYEPDTIVVNLTKTRGAGSLAHEFFHALDNYFERTRGSERAIGREDRYITYRPETYYEHIKFGQKLPASRFFKLRDSKSLKPEEWRRGSEAVRPEVEERFAALVKALNDSPMRKRSELIGKAGSDYWSRIIERAARAFESYVIYKMRQQGYENDYLANVTAIEDFARDPGRYPYLLDEEVKPVAEAFDDLFATIQTRETEQGVEMYSRERRAVRSAASFAEQLDDFAAGKIPNRMESITISQTPAVLQMLGVEQAPVVITQGTIEKATQGKHGISFETVKQLPEKIADPVMIFDSATEADSLVVMTDLKQDGKTIVAAIRISKEMGRNVVHDIVSVHPRNSEYHFIGWINQGLLRYMNRSKSRAWSVTSGLRLPAVRGPMHGLKNRMLFDSDLVKENYSQRRGLFEGVEEKTEGQPRIPGWTLADVQAIFKGQEVVQTSPGGPIYIKTRGGKYLTIESVAHITPNEVNFQLAYGRQIDRENETITGAYGQGNIRLVRGKAGKGTLAHESMHFLEDAGIINSSDVAILRGHIKGLVRDGNVETANPKDIGGKEDRAYFIADQLAAEKPARGLVGRVIARIREFLDRVMEVFGKRSARGVVRDIESGEIFGRGLTDAQETATSYAVTKKPGTANIPAKTTPKAVGGTKIPEESVVRDNSGNPIPVYHGSSSSFDKLTAENSLGVDNLVGYGIYTTESPMVAAGYTIKGVGIEPSIRQVYLDIRNPLDFDAKPTREFVEEFIDRAQSEVGWEVPEGKYDEILENASRGEYRDMKHFLKEYGLYDEDAPEYVMADEYLTQTIEDMGYDGITHMGGTEKNPHRVWVAFNDNQIIYPDKEIIPKEIYEKYPELLPNPSRPPEVGGQTAAADLALEQYSLADDRAMIADSWPEAPPAITRPEWTAETEQFEQHTSSAALMRHPDYGAAKAGDLEAARRVADVFFREAKAAPLARRAPADAQIVVLPVTAQEATGDNRLPYALAEKIADYAGWPMEDAVRQINAPERTGKGHLYRILNQPEFAGPVIPGAHYVLVDDVGASGATFLNLAGHVAAGGGKVLGFQAFGSGRSGPRIKPLDKSSQSLHDAYGVKLPAILRQLFGGQIDAEQLAAAEINSLVSHAKALLERGGTHGTGPQDGAVRGKYAQALPEHPVRVGSPEGTRLSEAGLNALVQDLARSVKGISVETRDGALWIKTRSGQEVRIEAVRQITPDEVALRLGYAAEAPEGARIAGKYTAAAGAQPRQITLARNAAGLWTLTHEFYHFLEDIGAIVRADIVILNRKIATLIRTDPGTYGYLQDRSLAERRAEWAGQTLSGTYDPKIPTGRILTKLRGIIDRIVNALGVRTAGGVVRDIKAGRVYDQGSLPHTENPPGKTQYALAEEAWRTGVVAPAGRRIAHGTATLGARVSPEVRQAAARLGRHWREFWRPFSTVPDGDKIIAARYRAMGNVARAVRFIEEINRKLDSWPDQVKRDCFWYLNGDIPIEALPEEARETAQMIRRRTEIIGEMLVARGILAEGQFEKYRGRYIHYLYAKHVLGEDSPIFLTSTGKLNLSYTKSRNPNLTLKQRKELGLIEDASVAVPVGMGKALTDIAKYDYLASIAGNADWVWQPSIVKVPVGKALASPVRGRTRRYVKMGIGKLVEEVKIYDKMMTEHPSPEVAEIRDILRTALTNAESESVNMPEDFVQLPNSKGYGLLAGAFVRKPIADDLMPVLDVATDRGKLMNTLLSIERQGMAGFKMGKVALNIPTMARNVISNIIQNNMRGRPLSKIPGDIIRACESLKAKDTYYEEAFGMGLFHTNWFVSEINEVLEAFRGIIPQKSWKELGRDVVANATLTKPVTFDRIVTGLTKLAKYYGKIDDINKLAIFIEQREAGKGVDEAVLEAMKWGMDYSLTSRSIKGLRQTIVPFACVDEQTEILTKRGWLRQDELKQNDMALSFDLNDAHLKWNIVADVYRAQYDGKLLHYKDRNLDMMLTPDHKCVVYKRKQKNFKRWNEYTLKYAHSLNSHDSIPVAGHYEQFPNQNRLSDAFVRIIGWVVTEGHYQKNTAQVCISQNEGINCDKIRHALNAEFPGGYNEQKTRANMVVFYIHADPGRHIRYYMPDKQLTPEFILSLTKPQLEILLETMIDGDGSRRKEIKSRWSFIQKKNKTLDMFQMALVLCGISHGYCGKDNTCKSIQYRQKSHYWLTRTPTKEVDYKGVIWCPAIPAAGTWVARRNGRVFLTGNTYQYKIAPLIAESLAKRPWVLAKYAMLFTAARLLAMALHDMDDDDWEDLEKQLPSYIKKSGSMMILPWKTDKGQWQWVNLEYFFPWGNYLAIFRDMRQTDMGEAIRDLGISNPFLSMFYTGLSTREDQPPLHAYFGTPIYNELDPGWMKAAKLVEYMANTWMPSMLTRQGALGYVGKAATGSEDRWGRTVSPGQAVGRWFGVNIIAVSPEQSRAQVSVRIQDLKKEMARIDADPSLDEETKTAYRQRLDARMGELAEAAPAAVLPITKAKGHDPVYDALRAMAAQGILRSAPPSRTIEIGGIPTKMSMDQYRDYLERSSEVARKKLAPIVSGQAWDGMSAQRKAETVKKIVSHARKGARQRVKAEIAREIRSAKKTEK